MNNGLLAHPVGSQRMLGRGQPAILGGSRVTRREHALIRYQITGSAGDPPVNSAFFTLALNTIFHDEIGLRLASNQVLLPPGTYRAYGRIDNMNGVHSNFRLRDVTEGRTLMMGNGTHGSGGSNGSFVVIHSVGRGLFAVTRETLIEMQGWYGGSGGSGWSMGIGTYGGGLDKFTTLELWRLAS